MRGMENDSRFGVLSVNASGLDGERVELGRFRLAEVQKHGIMPPPPHPQPRTPKVFRKWLKLHARVRAALQLLVCATPYYYFLLTTQTPGRI